jgi:hypothetical protein
MDSHHNLLSSHSFDSGQFGTEERGWTPDLNRESNSCRRHRVAVLPEVSEEGL